MWRRFRSNKYDLPAECFLNSRPLLRLLFSWLCPSLFGPRVWDVSFYFYQVQDKVEVPHAPLPDPLSTHIDEPYKVPKPECCGLVVYIFVCSEVLRCGCSLLPSFTRQANTLSRADRFRREVRPIRFRSLISKPCQFSIAPTSFGRSRSQSAQRRYFKNISLSRRPFACSSEAGDRPGSCRRPFLGSVLLKGLSDGFRTRPFGFGQIFLQKIETVS